MRTGDDPDGGPECGEEDVLHHAASAPLTESEK